MYVLCKALETPSVTHHNALNCILRSKDLREISDEIKKRVEAGTPLHTLKVFEELEIDLKMAVSIGVAKED